MNNLEFCPLCDELVQSHGEDLSCPIEPKDSALRKALIAFAQSVPDWAAPERAKEWEAILLLVDATQHRLYNYAYWSLYNAHDIIDHDGVAPHNSDFWYHRREEAERAMKFLGLDPATERAEAEEHCRDDYGYESDEEDDDA